MSRPLSAASGRGRGLRLGRQLTVAGLVLIVAALSGHRIGLGLLAVFGALLLGVVAHVTAAAVVLFAWVRGRVGRDQRRAAGVVLLTAGAVLAVPLWTVAMASGAPPIHDITTDVEDPPTFQAVVPRRGPSANPLDYPGPELADVQRQAYPDIQPIRVPIPPADTFKAAQSVAEALGWEIVSADEARGMLEAIDTTFWFGFADDVAVRVRPDGDGSRVDVRSVSRVGVGDLGANAARVRAFSERLVATVDTEPVP